METNKYLDGSLHYTKFSISAGGVGRNICEALEKLESKPVLLSVVGDDNHGKYLRAILNQNSARAVEVMSNHPTAQCTVVLDSKGECKLLLGEMDIHKKISPELIKAQQELLRQSPLIVTDGNLPVDSLACVLQIAETHGTPVFYEPTDIPVAANPFLTPNSRALKYISPNLNELRKITITLGLPLLKNAPNRISEAVDLGRLVSKFVDTIFITLGAQGLIIVRRGAANEPLFSKNLTINHDKEVQVRHYTANEVTKLVNVSGAGDCLASGLISAMLAGYEEEICVSVGFAAAQMALQSRSAVPNKLFDKMHKCWRVKAPYVQF